MINYLIAYSIRNKLVIAVGVVALIGCGLYSLDRIPIDAVPDITTNQVLVITNSPNLAAQEVEQFITFPLERSLANLPEVEEIRSLSRSGISVITVVFDDGMDTYRARQLISEQIERSSEDIPEGFGRPTLGPITTGLGEVYQYVLHADEQHRDMYSAAELRSINDWIVQRQLAGIPGVIEVNGWGGQLRQYEVAVDPDRLKSHEVTLHEVFDALAQNNQNAGGSYIEKDHQTYFIRASGLVGSLEEIGEIMIRNTSGIPLLIRDVAELRYGHAPRFGAVTYNAQGEVVSGQVLMFKGANSYKTVQAVKERVEQVRASLPEGVVLEPFIDRSRLIGNAIRTVRTNLLEGGLIVIFVLVLFLGNWRGGLIVASVIPLSMMFALCMMQLFGISANLMSLGAIDFGLVVDGSVIIVEAILHRLRSRHQGKTLQKEQMDQEVGAAAGRIRRSAAFGEVIILIVYLPILALVGIEGKMFAPMAQTVGFAILGALLLSMTYVPMMSAWFLPKKIESEEGVSQRIVRFFYRLYRPALDRVLRFRSALLVSALLLFGGSLWLFDRLGGEFIPTLEEGDFALHQILPPGSSLQESIEVSEKIQQALLDNFPEVEIALSKIGTAEIATDPMPIEVGDIILKMKPRSEWTTANSREEMFLKMEEVLSEIPGVSYEFTQPIQMRFNELIAGVREDIAIKIYGEEHEQLQLIGQRAERLIAGVRGVGDVQLERTSGFPQMIVRYDRSRMARYGVHIQQVNELIQAAFAGKAAGVVFEGERRYDLVVRVEETGRKGMDDLRELHIPLPDGQTVPLRELADIRMEEGPAQISRENAKRRIVIGVNARERDTQSLVEEIQSVLSERLEMPAGYHLEYGGRFENLMAAKERLSVAVPVALLLILILLYFTFGSLSQALMIFSAVPLSAIGGVWALWIRDMPFSISAGIGFIALFGVAVLNGIVLLSYLNQLEKEGMQSVSERIKTATQVRFRPVLLTAFVAALGFLPMALSGSAGAEVQRPLATVVIGGLISATLLTLLVLPVLYDMWCRWQGKRAAVAVLFFACFFADPTTAAAQELSLQQAVQQALMHHPSMAISQLQLEQQNATLGKALALEPTQVQYSRGQLNTEVQDYQWQLQQRFRFPTAYWQQLQLYRSEVDRAELQHLFDRIQLEAAVRMAWWEWRYQQSRSELYRSLDALAERFVRSAEKRFRSGQISGLERSRARSDLEKWRLMAQGVESELEIARLDLMQWIAADSLQLPEGAKMDQVPLPFAGSIDPSSYPQLALQRQRSESAQRSYRLSRSGYLPDLMIGYFNQSLERVTGQQGIQMGVSVPLFFWEQRSDAVVARKEHELQQARIEEVKRRIASEEKQLWSELEWLQSALNWYDDSGAQTARELQRYAEKAFELGTLDLPAHWQGLLEAQKIREDHLKNLRDFNQTSVRIQYLRGSFNTQNP